MPSRSKSRVLRRSRRSVNPAVIAVLAAALLSAVIAGIWQLQEPEPVQTAALNLDPALLDGPIRPSASAAALPQPLLPSEASSPPPVEEPSSQAEVSSSQAVVAAAAVVAGEPVPEQPRVTSSYFDDAAFIGDSITTGIKLYEVMENADVFASTGLSLSGFLTQEVIKLDGETVSVQEALKRTQPKKIYIMVGANSMAADLDWQISLYSDVLDSLKAQHPESKIYVQSVLPLHEETYRARYNRTLTNAQIDTFNERLSALTAEKGLYYLDVASAFKDETGGMPKEYTPDGVHMNSAQYIQWFDYLKEHAVA